MRGPGITRRFGPMTDPGGACQQPRSVCDSANHGTEHGRYRGVFIRFINIRRVSHSVDIVSVVFFLSIVIREGKRKSRAFVST